jgi:hypothetical protein
MESIEAAEAQIAGISLEAPETTSSYWPMQACGDLAFLTSQVAFGQTSIPGFTRVWQ